MSMKTDNVSRLSCTAWRRIGLPVLLCAAGLLCVAASAGEARSVQDLDCGWRFSLGDRAEAKSPGYDDAGWRALDLPHDWSIEGDYSATNPTAQVGGYLPSGIGWYRRAIEMPAAWQGRALTLEFEGVYMNSEVWLNGERVGGRPYGYMSFTCDLSGRMKPGRNVLAVRVDNSLEPSARWYHGCGIYGHVRLTVNDPVHVPTWGVYVTTPSVSGDAAEVRADVEVQNASGAEADVEVESAVVGPDGKIVARAGGATRMASGGLGHVLQSLSVKSPSLWSVESPALYALRTQVLRGGEAVDEVTTPFGIRSLRFDGKTGFYLNGRNLKLKGVCEHQGGSPFGAAIPDAALERRLRQLKEMGCNAVRASHNPQLPIFYDLCDRLGLMVMDEIFDGWHEKADHDYGRRYFTDWWKRDVTDWIRRDRNHPCVIFWSIGNETGKQDEHNLTKFIHALDDTRPTTGGAVIYGVDVAGFNGGIVWNDAALLDYHRDNPTIPVVMTEEPHSFQTRGFYRTVNAIFRPIDALPNYAEPEVFSGGRAAYRSSYDNCGRRLVARNCWKRTLERPWVMGEFRWTGFDYLGESGWSGNERLARAFNFGVIDLAGFPKDHYHFYRSIWTEAPMVHLLPHWTHPGLEGREIPVVAYANAEEVELCQDGRSLGRKPRSDLFECVWKVPYKPGELKALAYRGGKVVAETVQRTAAAPARLQLTTDNAALKADRRDLAFVSVAVLDERGTLVPDAAPAVALAVTGPARWIGGENGDPVDITPQRETTRSAFNGLLRGFYAGKDGADGPVEVLALAVLGSPRASGPTEVRIVAERVALRGALDSDKPEIRYTIDGSEPTAGSPLARDRIETGAAQTVKAAVFRNGRRLCGVSASLSSGATPRNGARAGAGGDQGEAEDPLQSKPAP